MSKHVSSLRESHQRPNETVLPPTGRARRPAAINSPSHQQGGDLSAGLTAQEHEVLTCRRPAGTESAGRRTPNAH